MAELRHVATCKHVTHIKYIVLDFPFATELSLP